MRLLWMTDIHLNFLEPEAVTRFLQRLAARHAGGVLISGDIGESGSVIDYLGQLHARLGIPLYFVLGNHDYYHGSIAGVRAAVLKFVSATPGITWLNSAEVVSLTSATALIGHDAWADGRLGDFERSSVELNDFQLIAELRTRDRRRRLEAMMALGDEAAAHFARTLPKALKTHQKVLILTHVAPFEGAAWYHGKVSDKDWLPFFSCQAVGDVLRSVMASHPDKEALVLCGHTHGAGRFQALPNLAVVSGDARYGRPKVQMELVVE